MAQGILLIISGAHINILCISKVNVLEHIKWSSGAEEFIKEFRGQVVFREFGGVMNVGMQAPK